MSWMFHITGCAVQTAVAKAKEVAKQTQEALEQVQKGEKADEDDSEEEEEEDDEAISAVAQKKKETEA